MGIRDLCLSRGLGDVYKRQVMLGADSAFMSRMATSELNEARSDSGVDAIGSYDDYT